MATTTASNSETLIQVKLTSEEWNGVEIMESEEEMRILQLIIDGFHDVNRVFNPHQSLISRLKITATPEMHDYIFDEYFRKRVERVISALGHTSNRFEIHPKSKKTMKKMDLMRIQNMNTTYGGSGDTYDHHIMDTIDAMIAAKTAVGTTDDDDDDNNGERMDEALLYIETHAPKIGLWNQRTYYRVCELYYITIQ